ncbi:MAG TPA: condensation domain-containing protein, partial [Pyrinomonadaceae bacterium]|nr:condensation domain-containing protein [Pyrinomonadaceae bacterium]
MNDKKKVEAIYELSPLQEGMLFHTAANPAAGLYFEQTSYSLSGRLDVERFRLAWESAVERHAILRTAFNRGATAQVVFKRASAPWTCLDWRELPEAERESALQDFLTRDRQEGFDITNAPLLRFALMRLTDATYKFVVSYHHVLLDGWSYVRLLKEVTTTYEALGRGASTRLPEPRPFRDYIKWLKRQDGTKAEEFWRGRLRGIAEPVYLADAFSKNTPGGELNEIERVIDSEATGLAELTRRAQVTLNTIVQGAWALLLSRYTGKSSLLFGATVSGRPHDLPGVES